MQIKRHKIKITVFTLLIAVSVMLAGCVDFGASQAGWSGVVYGNGSLYLGAAGGKLVSLNSENGFYQWQETLDAGAAGGGLGCAPAASGIIYATPALEGDTLFAGDYSGKIHAFSVTDRQSKSVFLDETAPQPIIGGPLVSHENVYIGSIDGYLYAFDAASLTFRWRFGTGGEIWSTPAVWQDSIFIGSFDKKIYSINANTGQANWDQPFETKGPIIASPVIAGDMIIVVSLDRIVYALDADSGELIWQFPAMEAEFDKPERWLWATPVLHDGTLYVPSMDGHIYVLNSDSGTLLQVIEVGESVASKPVIVGGRLVVATENGKIYSIDTDSNQRIELRNLDTQLVAPLGTDGEVVFVHSVRNNEVLALNPETGALYWSTSIN